MARPNFPGIPPGFQNYIRNQFLALEQRMEKLERRNRQFEVVDEPLDVTINLAKPKRRGRKPKGDAVDG